MIVVDIESSGTDPIKNSIVSIGAVDFSHPEIQFSGECCMWDGAHADPAALAVNGFSETEIVDAAKITEAELVAQFLQWAEGREEQTMAGQNPHFDLGFIQAAAHRAHLDIRLAHRLIDQHSLVYFHMVRRGLTPPVAKHHSALNSDAIMQYVGIPTEPKPHIALNGAIFETEVFHRLMFDKPFLPQFADFPVPWAHE